MLLVIAAAVAAAIAVLSASGVNTPKAAAAVSQKRYKATRPVIVDKQTGKVRMPTAEEVDQMVGSLETLAKRPEGLAQENTASGGVAVDLDGGFGGVMLARPGEGGTWETRCVFTFEEGAEFLGLEAEEQ